MGGTVAKQQPETTMTDNNADDSTETTDKDDTPTANGVELDSVVGVANAFSYLDKMYNVGDITVRTSEDCILEDTVRISEDCSLEDLVIIRSRGTQFSHMGPLLQSQKQGHISIQHISTGTNRVGDPCLNIEVVGGDESDDDDTPTANGVELDSVVAVANAFAHLDDPWIVGDITVRSSEDLVIIHSRGACFGHMETLLEAQKQGHISIQSIAVGANHDSDCLSIEVVGGNDSTETTDKHATLTEHLSAARNTDDSIDGAAKITHVRNGTGVWQTDDGERLEDDPDEYRVECSCGESFGSCGNAIHHADEE